MDKRKKILLSCLLLILICATISAAFFLQQSAPLVKEVRATTPPVITITLTPSMHPQDEATAKHKIIQPKLSVSPTEIMQVAADSISRDSATNTNQSSTDNSTQTTDNASDNQPLVSETITPSPSTDPIVTNTPTLTPTPTRGSTLITSGNGPNSCNLVDQSQCPQTVSPTPTPGVGNTVTVKICKVDDPECKLE
jgi:hypothetical protein